MIFVVNSNLRVLHVHVRHDMHNSFVIRNYDADQSVYCYDDIVLVIIYVYPQHHKKTFLQATFVLTEVDI